jgi:imidazolonepropionase-like amidohydrolase
VVDIEGGFVLPGLIDAHQHLNAGGFSKESQAEKIALLRRNLYWGITTVHNPNINPTLMRAVQKAAREKPNLFPTFLASGQMIGITGGWGDVKVKNFHEFKQAATRQLAGGADSVKVSADDMSWLSNTKMESFPAFLLKQAAQLMHTNGKRIYVHTSQIAGLRDAVNAGVDAVLHGTVNAPIDQNLINQMKGRGIGYVSTLAWYEVVSDARKAVAAMKAYDPHRANSSLLYDNMSSDLMVLNFRDWWPKSGDLGRRLPIVRGNTLALVRAGALVGIGTDAGTPAVIFGASLPYEMHLHEQLGIHPLTVVQLATANNARILGIADKTGRIETGKEADLIYLTEDPSAGIRSLNSLVWTMQNGNIIYREELAR